MSFTANYFQKKWYSKSIGLLALLLPLSWLYYFLSVFRRNLYQYAILQTKNLPVPLIVVGNISVGGTGKTPLVVALVEYLRDKGFNPGVVSRGYGGSADQYPMLVTSQTSAQESGDEALLIFRRTGVPVVVDPKRARAASLLAFEAGCDVIISDDGLQHYAMGRDFEIVVVDVQRGFGNGHLLPVGPLRERLERLSEVDLLVLNKSASKANLAELSNMESTRMCDMDFSIGDLVPLKNTAFHQLPMAKEKVHAIAGIGNPVRFFETLEKMGFEVVRHTFSDHFDFRPSDLEFGDDLAIVMTEKDAVKCDGFEKENMWYLPVDGKLSDNFYQRVNSFLGIKEPNPA